MAKHPASASSDARPNNRTAPSMARKHNTGAPAYFQWRGGRPRWIPSPQLRARGETGTDLKDAHGAWLGYADACKAARAINDRIAGRGLAPAAAAAREDRSLRALIAAYKSKRKWTGGAGGPEAAANAKHRVLGDKTKEDYGYIFALLDAWAGDVAAAAITREMCEDFYDALLNGKSLSRANAILRVLRLLLNFGMDVLSPRWLSVNPCAKLGMQQAHGRTVRWTPQEIVTLVAAADWLGGLHPRNPGPSLGDAAIIAVCTARQRSEILAAPPLVPNAAGVFDARRNKTQRLAMAPQSAPLMQRLGEANRRIAARWPAIAFTTQVVSEVHNGPYPPDGDYFTHAFARLRLVASGQWFQLEAGIRALMGLPPLLRNLPFTPLPSIADKQFADFRDTAITMIFNDTKDIGRTATVSGHSLKQAQAIIDKHYFDRHAGLAIDAIASFDALLQRES